jgi:hypothetical protein|nr:hypothetical protein [Nonlabens sp. Ci31]
MDLIISPNGYSDYKRKVLEDKEEFNEKPKEEKYSIPLQSHL